MKTVPQINVNIINQNYVSKVMKIISSTSHNSSDNLLMTKQNQVA